MTGEAPHKKTSPGLLKSLVTASAQIEGELRRRNPGRFQGAPKDILSVDQVAAILRCSVDQARRIPRKELPAYQGPGKYVLFFREDVLSYLRGRPRKNESMAHGNALKARRGQTVETLPDGAHSFDPGAVISLLPGRGR